MKNKAISYGVVVIMLLFVVGCSSNANGIYYKETDVKSYMELKDSDLFSVHDNSKLLVEGEYFIEGKDIKFKFVGRTSGGKIEDNTIIDADGVRWTKK